MQLGTEIFDQLGMLLARGQHPHERGFVEREPVIGGDVIGGRAGIAHEFIPGERIPSVESSQSKTGRHNVSRWREAKKPSCPMRCEPTSAGVYQRASRAAFGKNL